MKVKLSKGFDLKLAGGIDAGAVAETKAEICAVVPDDFPGFVPKADVREGDTVEKGSVLMHDKLQPHLCLVSPVSGTVRAVVRGERRKILRVEVTNDHMDKGRRFDTASPLLQLLGQSGLLAMVRTRPFDTVPDTSVRPRDIFVNGLDTAPLAVDPSGLLGPDAAAALQAGVKALKTLTDGKVYLTTGPGWTLGEMPGAENVQVQGPHPAGAVSFQIAAVEPVDKGETVWTLGVDTLCGIGRLMLDGTLDTTVTVAVTGPEVEKPGFVRTVRGARLDAILRNNIKNDGRNKRIISGNVFTGVAEGLDGWLRAPWRQVTVIAEGDDVDEFMGWASVSPSKLSVSRALPLRGLRNLFAPDARLNGGRRAMIMSGEYDRVFPADILPEYLIKAIISRNIDDMEALGIYEVAPEDFALCEFVDTSKLPLQQIVRDGLDYLRKELN